ncbi:MAG: hypothetical protein ACTIM4_13665 [Marinomonas sp.]
MLKALMDHVLKTPDLLVAVLQAIRQIRECTTQQRVSEMLLLTSYHLPCLNVF